MRRVKFEVIRSDVNSWQNLFEQAANTATLIGPDRLINISQSSDENDSVVTVWYWAEEETNILGIKEAE